VSFKCVKPLCGGSFLCKRISSDIFSAYYILFCKTDVWIRFWVRTVSLPYSFWQRDQFRINRFKPEVVITRVNLTDRDLKLHTLLCVMGCNEGDSKIILACRPRLIGIGCGIIAAGYFLASMPHYIGEAYKYRYVVVGGNVTEAEEQLCRWKDRYWFSWISLICQRTINFKGKVIAELVTRS